MKVNRFLLSAALCGMLFSGCAGGSGQNDGQKTKTESGSEAAAPAAGQEAATAADDRGYIVKTGDQVPSFDIVLPDGTKTSVDALKGKVVMLQFTASWCSVCRKEMPFIEKEIWQPLKSNPEFALYGIDLKEDAEQIRKFAELIPVTYPIALDPEGAIFSLFCRPDAGVTRNIILDREGKIIFLTRLYERTEFEEMVRIINAELADKQ